jgi:hypothetical protein
VVGVAQRSEGFVGMGLATNTGRGFSPFGLVDRSCYFRFRSVKLIGDISEFHVLKLRIWVNISS